MKQTISDRQGSRDGLSHRVVFAALGVSLALAFGLSLYVYQRYVRYVPRVAAHVPEDYALAMRIDVEQAVVYEPFRQRLLPLLEANRPSDPKGGGRKASSRLEALEAETTIEFGVDLREVGIVVDQRGRWLVLLGGHFRRDGVVRGVAELLQREGVKVSVRGAPERLIHASGAAFGPSDDGVLILAQTEELLLSVLGPRTPRRELGQGSALSVVFGEGDPGPLGGAELQVRPGETFDTTLRLPRIPRGTDEAAVTQLISGKTGDFRVLEGTTGWAIRNSDAGSPEATAVLSRSDFDRLVANLASGLAALLDLSDVPIPPPLPPPSVSAL